MLVWAFCHASNFTPYEDCISKGFFLFIRKNGGIILTKTHYRVNKLVTVAILAALGTILMMVEIPSFISWLKFDLSDVVVYLSAVIYGPIAAIVVAFVKSALHYIIKGSFVGVPIDQFIAFVASLAYAIPLYYFTKLFAKREYKRYAKIVPLILSSIAMTVIMAAINLWLTDIYIRLLITFDITKIGSVTTDDVIHVVVEQLNFTLPQWIQNSRFLPKSTWFWFIILTYVPFNLAKTVLTSSLYYVLSFRLEYILERFKLSNKQESVLLQIQNEPQNSQPWG